MRLLLPMAYVFLIIFEKNSNANKEVATINDNFTYRLMTLKPVRGTNNEEEDNLEPINASPATHKYSQYMKSRRKLPKPISEDDSLTNSDDSPDTKRRPRNNQQPSNIPDDFEEEISQFQIAAGVPKKIQKPKKHRMKQSLNKEKKTKVKNSKKKQTKPKVEENNDETHEEEEEEETEEKKEKIHKVTIKKKRPHKNITKIANVKTQPYIKIGKGQKISGSRPSPHRMKYPLWLSKNTGRPNQFKPLKMKENAAINPILYHNKKSTHKGVRQRDVNLIVKSNQRTPKILIRRYKPIISIVGYPALVTSKKRVPLAGFKRSQKRKQKNQRRKKIHNPKAEAYFPFAPLSSNPDSCDTDYPQGANNHNSFSYPSFTSADQTIYPSYQNVDQVRERYPKLKASADMHDDDDDDDKVPNPSLHQENPPESISNIHFTTAEPNEDKTEETLSEIEPTLSGGYDVNEHENTEELAALHKQETDENIEAEEEADPIPDDEPDNNGNDDQNEETEEIAGLEYETDESETDPDFILGFKTNTKGRNSKRKIRN